MTDDELRQLLQETADAQYEADAFSDDMPTRAVARPPATPQQIERLANHLRGRGLVLPPSLTQLLRVHNGIVGYIPSYGLSLRSAEEIEQEYERDAYRWKDISPAHRFVLASGDTYAFAGFLPDTLDDRGEMRVVLVNESAETTEYDDLQDFLKDCLEYYRSVLRAERADREGLRDD